MQSRPSGLSRRTFVTGLAPVLAIQAQTSERIRTGMIGIGNRGSLLLTTVLADSRARVVALCDIKADRLDKAATAAAADRPATLSDYRRLLERKDVDAVFIATPCDLHAEMAIAALQAGKHVYCEKPLATTPEAVAAVLRAVQAAHTTFKDRKATPPAEAQQPSRLLEGDVDWKAVMTALVRAGYRGPMSPEIGHDPEDPGQLAAVSKALDRILGMA